MYMKKDGARMKMTIKIHTKETAEIYVCKTIYMTTDHLEQIFIQKINTLPTT